MTQSDIWVLADHRTGTAIQAIALAEVLDMSFEVKQIKYNMLASLPNFLLGSTSVHANKKLSSPLYDRPPPALIISAGRRTAPIALALKNHYPNVKVVQIMRPCLAAEKFDLIILPQHDRFDTSANTFKIIGSLHNVENKIKDAAVSFRENYSNVHKFIALLIGGSTKKYKFTSKDAAILSARVSEVSANHGLPVFISFSRRTPDAVKKVMAEAFPWPHTIYDPTTSTDPNPYFGLLATADFIISTCDSISMCTEATATRKPFYIFCPDNADMPKHRYFTQQLIDIGLARKLEEGMEILENYKPPAFNECRKVAEFIKKNIL